MSKIVSGAVATAFKVTKGLGLQPYVYHQVWKGQDSDGDEVTKKRVKRNALVELKTQNVKTRSGQMAVAKAYVAFLEPVIIGDNDIITLPDGTTGPILMVSGFVNADTNKPYLAEVWLG